MTVNSLLIFKVPSYKNTKIPNLGFTVPTPVRSKDYDTVPLLTPLDFIVFTPVRSKGFIMQWSF